MLLKSIVTYVVANAPEEVFLMLLALPVIMAIAVMAMVVISANDVPKMVVVLDKVSNYAHVEANGIISIKEGLVV